MKIENEYFTIEIIPSTNYVLEGVLNKLYVLLEIKGKKRIKDVEIKEREPLDLALVLDRSGSMHGTKIKFAKKGVEYVINNVKSKDHVTLVSYDDQITVEFKGYPSKKREAFIRKIQEIQPRNSTALYDAVKRGYSELSDDKSKLRKVFLFSDGLANVGIRDPDLIKKLAGEIFQNKVSVSAFGIGDDFDERLMSGIAEYGRGDYHYIEDPDQIPLVIQEALEGVVNILAMDLNLELRGTNGSTIIKAFNYKSPATIAFPIYREEDEMQIILEIDVIPERLSNSKEVLTVKLDFSSPENPLDKLVLNGVFKVQPTNDSDEIVTENPRVMNFLSLERIREEEESIQDRLRENDFDGAIDLQKNLMNTLIALNSNEDTILDKIDLMKINLNDLARNKESMNAMRSMKYSHHQSYLSSVGSSSRKSYLRRMKAKEQQFEEDSKKEK